MIRTILLTLGTVLPLAGSVWYIRSILRGVSKPQRTTRLLLTLVTALAFFALLLGGDTSGVWLALASFIEAALIWVLSFKHGMGGRDRLDLICIGLCLIGLAAWLVTGKSVAGLVAAIVADFIAVVPSLIKTWRLPHTEDATFYASGCLAGALIVAAGPYDVVSLLFPLYILVIDAVFVVAIRRHVLLRRFRDRRTAQS